MVAARLSGGEFRPRKASLAIRHQMCLRGLLEKKRHMHAGRNVLSERNLVGRRGGGEGEASG